MSEHITDTQPSPSTERKFLIMAFCFAIFEVPIANAMVTIDDNASGIAATAKATANSSASVKLPIWYHDMPKTTAQMTIIIIESFLIGLFSFICAFILSNIVLFFIKNVKTLQGYVNGEISLDLAIYIFVTSILMAIIGSIIPALNAAKTDPVLLIQGNKI